MSYARQRTEVLVVGAGPVGLMSALLLSSRGAQVQIVDREWRAGAHTYGVALHAASLRLLDQLGLLADVLRIGHRVDGVAFYDGHDRCAELKWTDLPRDEEPHPYLLAIRQDQLEGLLEQALAKRGVNVAWNHALGALIPQGDRVFATLDEWGKQSGGYSVTSSERVVEKTTPLDCAFVVGADGHRSSVRRSLGIDFADAGHPDYFKIFEFTCEEDFGPEARVILDDADQTSHVVWPLGGGRYRWSFQLGEIEVPTEEPTALRDTLSVHVGEHAYPYVAEESLHRLIEVHAPWFKAEVTDVTSSMGVRFERRMAGELGRGRCWLAGDAAHLIGPVGVHSLNVGLREVDDLTARIARVLHEGDAVDSLDEYERKWRREWDTLLGRSGAACAAQASAAPWVRSHAARLLPCIPASGKTLARLAGRLGLVVGSG